MNFENIISNAVESFLKNIESIGNYLPQVFYFICFIFIAYLISKSIAYILFKLIKKIISRITLNAQGQIAFQSFYVKVPRILKIFVFWISFVFFLFLSFEIFEIKILQNIFQTIMFYVPKLLGSILILLLGFFLSEVLSNLIKKKVSFSKDAHTYYFSEIIRWFVLLVSVSIGLAQAGIRSELIIIVISIALASLFLTFGFAFALSVPKIISEYLAIQSIQKEYKIGDYIKIQDYTGKIIDFSHASILLEEEGRQHRIPGLYFLKNVVSIYSDTLK